jgi:T-complex protein 1 subunit beta
MYIYIHIYTGSGNLDYIQVIKKPGGSLADSFLEEGFVLNKSFGVGQPRRVENAKIMIANTPMDTDKIKIYGSRVRVDSMTKVMMMFTLDFKMEKGFIILSICPT